MWRVLQVHTNSGWEQGLADLLRQEPDLEVYSVAYTNEPILLSDVTRVQPDVILFNEDAPLSPTPLRQLLADASVRSAVRIIVLNERNNVIDIYDPHKRQQVVMTRLADLSYCIRGEPRD